MCLRSVAGRPGRCRPEVASRPGRGPLAGRLDWLHLHELRHAFATFLLDQGEELRTVMELLGHSTIRMTADTYGHVLPARARQAASAIDRILGQEGTA
ncbi:tyrosine-type recombinase/integrase [Micromonospora parva]|uniref:tyrosine-type recombinase/integrase n=1 Tax=Micromonospora parva TaxID=1464048 RepID=UPI0033E8637E